MARNTVRSYLKIGKQNIKNKYKSLGVGKPTDLHMKARIANAMLSMHERA